MLQSQVVDRTLTDATRSARIIARLGVQPTLTPQNLRHGLSAAEVADLDSRLNEPLVGQDLARIKVWNGNHRIVYSEDHSLIGCSPEPSDDLEAALDGHPHGAQLVDPTKDSETASEVGLGELIEVYVPLRFSAGGPPAGVFEIYLSYKPVAAAVQRDKRMIALLLAIGLALLWAVLYRIVARASRRLRRQSEENYRLARYDTLTGLPNRTLFVEEVARAARGAQRRGGGVAVLLIDLERFSAINNTLGAHSGDEVLREVARRLDGRFEGGARRARRRRRVRDPVPGARPRPTAPASAPKRSCVPSSRRSRSRRSRWTSRRASGVAVLGEHADDPEVLLQRADLALAHARSHGSRVEVYSPRMERSDAARLKLLGQVRGALAAGEFVAPLPAEGRPADARITGVEALVRWRHPELGLLSPDRFIPHDRADRR